MRRLRWQVVWMVLLALVLAGGCAAPAATTGESAPAAAEEAAAESETVDEPAEEAAPSEVPAEAAAPADADLPVVGLIKLVSHPALDAEQQGVKDALAEAGFIDGETVRLIEANADGDIPTLTTIAQQFVDEGVDLLVTTSTPATQAAYNVTQDQEGPPIVFNAVTSPYATGFATAPDDHPGGDPGRCRGPCGHPGIQDHRHHAGHDARAPLGRV